MGNVDGDRDASYAWASARVRFRCLVRVTRRIGIRLELESNYFVRASARWHYRVDVMHG